MPKHLQIAVVGLIIAGCDQAPSRRSEEFVRHVGGSKKQDIGDLAQVLRIEQMEGKVELNSGFNNVTLVLAAYQDGKKVELSDSEMPLLASYETTGTISYAVNIVDLDFLPVGHGKKGHCRLRISFRMPDDSTMALEKDVPKTVIDLSQSSNLSFTEFASSSREAPLLWMIAGGEIPVTLKTPQQVLEKVTKGNLLFVTLRFNDPTKEKGKP
ncbi:MAG: hypothetical protein ACJ8FY_07685 [Gemmataceae bacterium]